MGRMYLYPLFQPYDSLIQHHKFLFHHHVLMVVSEEPVFETAAFPNFIEIVRQGIPLVPSATEYILDATGAAVGYDTFSRAYSWGLYCFQPQGSPASSCWPVLCVSLSARTESMPADFAKVGPSQVLSLAEDISSGSWRTLRKRSSVRAVARTAGMHFSRNSEGSPFGSLTVLPKKATGEYP